MQATVTGRTRHCWSTPDPVALSSPGNLGTSHLEVLRALHESGAHLEKIGYSGYSGGVDYTYREYDGLTVDYGNGDLTTTNTPVDVVMHSHGTSADAPHNFVAFLQDNDVTGILGIGDNTAGPTESPLEAAGFGGVTVNIAGHDLIVGSTNTLAGPRRRHGKRSPDHRPDRIAQWWHPGSGFRRCRLRWCVRHHPVIPRRQRRFRAAGKTRSRSSTAPRSCTPTRPGPTASARAPRQRWCREPRSTAASNPTWIEPIFIDYANDTLTFDSPD